jgi:hypothetical protein
MTRMATVAGRPGADDEEEPEEAAGMTTACSSPISTPRRSASLRRARSRGWYTKRCSRAAQAVAAVNPAAQRPAAHSQRDGRDDCVIVVVVAPAVEVAVASGTV